jgi:hypothetical protein
MYWLQPPPHLRRVGAALLVVGALLWDLRGSATVAYPVAAHQVSAGSAISDDDVRWVRLPAGVLPDTDLTGAVAAVDIAPGDPIALSIIAPAVTAPDGWWAVPIEVGSAAIPGDTVLLVVADPPLTVPGLVMAPQEGDPLSLDYRPALVAVPGEAAAVVAAAERAGLLVAAVKP